EMAGDKTAALMACACTIGAVHVGAPPEMAMGLAEFGGHVGLAFQLTDDLLGIWGAPEVTGQPVRADLRARKKSPPVGAALSIRTPAGTELAQILASDDELTEDDLTRAADLVVAAGGRQWAEQEADGRLAAAAASLDGIGVPADVRAEFVAIAEFITPRQWGSKAPPRRWPMGHRPPTKKGDGPSGTPKTARRTSSRSRPPRSSGRGITSSACRIPAGGGRASWRPTSPWTPRTCCSATSSASSPPSWRPSRPAGSGASSA